MADMYITHFKASPPSVQTARPKSRQTPFMRQLAQCVGLVNNLAQLTTTKEIVDTARYALGINQISDAQRLFDISFHTHPFLNGPAQLKQPFSDFICCEFIDCSQPPVAQMIDIINLALIIPQSHYVFHRVEEIFRP